jgi:hypothetical protein
VFSQDFWFRVLAPLGFKIGFQVVMFADWWRKAVKKIQKDTRKGLDLIIILGAWVIWKYRNSCVFGSTQPCINDLLRMFREEQHL